MVRRIRFKDRFKSTEPSTFYELLKNVCSFIINWYDPDSISMEYVYLKIFLPL